MKNRYIESQQQIMFCTQLRMMEQYNRFTHLEFLKFTAIPDVGKASAIQGRRNKAAGYLAGFPDVSFFWKLPNGVPQFGFIEFKAKYDDFTGKYKGRLSPEQKQFSEDCAASGIKYRVAYSAVEGLEILKEWGVTL